MAASGLLHAEQPAMTIAGYTARNDMKILELNPIVASAPV